MQKRLLHLLLDYVEGIPHWRIADEVGLSPTNMSRLASGITSRPKSLEKAATLLSTRLGVNVEPALLQVQIDAEALVDVARLIQQRKTAA
jgi:hypothetical protein